MCFAGSVYIPCVNAQAYKWLAVASFIVRIRQQIRARHIAAEPVAMTKHTVN